MHPTSLWRRLRGVQSPSFWGGLWIYAGPELVGGDDCPFRSTKNRRRYLQWPLPGRYSLPLGRILVAHWDELSPYALQQYGSSNQSAVQLQSTAGGRAGNVQP